MDKRRLRFPDEPLISFSDMLMLVTEAGIPLHEFLRVMFSGDFPGYDKDGNVAEDPEFTEFVKTMCAATCMSRAEFEEAILNGTIELKVKTGPLPLSGFNEEKEPTFH